MIAAETLQEEEIVNLPCEHVKLVLVSRRESGEEEEMSKKFFAAIATSFIIVISVLGIAPIAAHADQCSGQSCPQSLQDRSGTSEAICPDGQIVTITDTVNGVSTTGVKCPSQPAHKVGNLLGPASNEASPISKQCDLLGNCWLVSQ